MRAPSEAEIDAGAKTLRADEHHLWKKANHHPPTRPEAGL